MKTRPRFLQRKRLPVKTVCRNCGMQTVGRYCHLCGQDIFAGEGLPIFALIWHLFESAFSLDNKTPVTLKYLLLRPGFLSAEYREGKIIRYVHPVKLFWMSTLIFFALLLANVNWGDTADTANNAQPAAGQTADPGSVKPGTTDDADEWGDLSPDELRLIRLFTEAQHKKDLFSNYAPYVAFLFIPVFALLLALFFWRNKFYYMYHLTFAVHFHAFLWIFFSLLIVVSRLTGAADWPGWLKLALFLVPGVYLMMAIYRFYNTKKKRTAVWKAIALTLTYVLLIMLVTAFSVFLVASIYSIDL